jgi:hypothetical protein
MSIEEDKLFEQLVINALPEEALPVDFVVSSRNGYGVLKLRKFLGAELFREVARVIGSRFGGWYERANVFIIPRRKR